MLAGLPLTERLGETGFMVTMKLLTFPALVYLLLSLVLPELDPVWHSVAALSAAASMGANGYLVAVRYEAYGERGSTAVLASTVLSVVTVSALVVVFG